MHKIIKIPHNLTKLGFFVHWPFFLVFKMLGGKYSNSNFLKVITRPVNVVQYFLLSW